MVEISLSGSGEGPGRVTAPGYSTALPRRAPARPSATMPRVARLCSSERTPQKARKPASLNLDPPRVGASSPLRTPARGP